MRAALVGVGLLLLFLLSERLGDRLGEGARPRLRRLPLLALALLLCLAGVELARFDHGLPDVVFAVAFVAAPIVVIFCGALAGARRFYGWPDLGPTPGRLAFVALALLLGVLAGARVRAADVEASMARGRALAERLAAHRARTGAWPARLEEAGSPPPRTRLGQLAPPSFDWDPAAARLSFRLGARSELALDVGAMAGGAPPPDWTRRDR